MAHKLEESSDKINKEEMQKTIFGHPSIAESLIEWGNKAELGTSFTKYTPWGLEMVFIATETYPLVIINFNQKKAVEFIEEMGMMSCLILESYGVGMVAPVWHDGCAVKSNKATVNIYLTSNGNIKIHEFTMGLGVEMSEFGLGMITIEDSGFYYHTHKEALAISESLNHRIDELERQGKTTTDTPVEQDTLSKEQEGLAELMQQAVNKSLDK